MDKVRKIMTYEVAVDENLNNCFNKDGSYNENKKYIDPDQYTYFEEEITTKIMFPANEQKFTIGFRSDGVFSRTKFSKINREDMGGKTDKELYAFFRKNMEKCLIWPSRTWSINQARHCLGNDDRIDLLLVDISRFYEICKEYKEISAEFIYAIISQLPKTCYAFINMPTLIWLCSFKDFNDFVMKRKLQAFVESDGDGFYATQWKDYYKTLYERVDKYKIANALYKVIN